MTSKVIKHKILISYILCLIYRLIDRFLGSHRSVITYNKMYFKYNLHFKWVPLMLTLIFLLLSFLIIFILSPLKFTLIFFRNSLSNFLRSLIISSTTLAMLFLTNIFLFLESKQIFSFSIKFCIFFNSSSVYGLYSCSQTGFSAGKSFISLMFSKIFPLSDLKS